MAIESVATRCTIERFVDTNVLLYSVSRDADELGKADRANEILSGSEVALSVQVLGEFYVQATRKSRSDPLTHEQAAGLVESFTRFPIVELTERLVLAALVTCQRFTVSYWDALILEAGRSLGCEVVLSEDLSHGQEYGGIRVENPFLDEFV